ncbi:cytidylyltransferase domain-containing protein [Helicobacter bilis]|uniref:Pseudaminic acid cytidylyltransferase n=1 Tax=Helicobacter bilis TaxID=37372 RepID=A0A4U8UG58_9HELI|nr:hypothetical protein [Helicobacter bilis]TLE12202.1 hypothetical protein LS79_000350 [Helicobacter bilis]
MKQIDCVIIPARGGSKRIPRKNMQPFCGISMLERSIDLARRLSDNVIVSSDDYSILEFAESLGAYPLLRNKALADDMTPTLPVIIHALLPFIKADSFDKGLFDSNPLFANLFDSNTLRHKSQNNKSLDSYTCHVERSEISSILNRDISPFSKVQDDRILDSKNSILNPSAHIEFDKKLESNNHAQSTENANTSDSKNAKDSHHISDKSQNKTFFENHKSTLKNNNTTLQSDKNTTQNKPALQIFPHSKVLCLYATAMFATEEIILESCFMLDKNPNTAYIVAMLEASKTFRSFCLDESRHLNFLFPEFIGTRSQDLPQAFIDAGQFYLGRAESFLKEIPLLGDKSMGIIMQYAHDIDTTLDLAIAESLFSHINKGGE